MKKLVFLTLALLPMIMATAQQELPLYGTGPIPNSKPGPDQEVRTPGSRGSWDYGLTRTSRPTLLVFLPEKGKATGMGIVVCPGGGYSHVTMGHEGLEVAHMLNEAGIAAFVLKYRLPSDDIMPDKTIGPLQDAQRAIQMVRQQAKEWGVDTARVGIMGFSAGGHLASTAGTHFEKATISNDGHVSLRPDFMILIYPVISFSDSICHRGSREALIGKDPSPSLITEYSNELQVTARTPPTFLVHAEDDKTVPVANSIHFYESLLHNKVPAELHIYPGGGHGYGLHNKTTKDEWSERLVNWLATLPGKSNS